MCKAHEEEQKGLPFLRMHHLLPAEPLSFVFLFLHQTFYHCGSNSQSSFEDRGSWCAHSAALSKETNCEMRILKVCPSKSILVYAVGFHSPKCSSSSTQIALVGSSRGRRLYITSSPYRERTCAEGKLGFF